MNNFTEESWAAFQEAASEKYDFAACKSGEKMTFGKCQKVGGSGNKQSPEEFKKKVAADRKARAERNLKKYPPSHKLHKQAKKDLSRP